MKINSNEAQALQAFNIQKKSSLGSRLTRNKAILLLLVPGIIWYLLFKYLPMLFAGVAFTDYGLKADVHFIGLENFQQLFSSPGFWGALRNTLLLSGYNLIFYFPLPIILALCMNELGHVYMKRIAQFIVYIPHFFSWVVVGSVFVLVLSPSDGVVNHIIQSLGGDPIYFMAAPEWFRKILVGSYVWRDVGYGTIIYIATIATIDVELYDAATVDGAGHWGKLWSITLPCLKGTIATVLLLTVARILKIFEQVLVMTNDNVLSVSEVLDTYAYTEGLLNSNIGYATAISLFTALVSTLLVIGCNVLSKRFLDESIL
jgi:putative aldouronate transport system permease protein